MRSSVKETGLCLGVARQERLGHDEAGDAGDGDRAAAAQELAPVDVAVAVLVVEIVDALVDVDGVGRGGVVGCTHGTVLWLPWGTGRTGRWRFAAIESPRPRQGADGTLDLEHGSV